MAIVIWLLLVIGPVVLFENLGSQRNKGLRAFCWVVTVLMFFSPLYFEFPNWPISQVVTFDNGKVVKHRFGAFTIEREFSNLPGIKIISYESLMFMTENPKIKKLEYKLRSQITDTDVFFRKTERRMGFSFQDGDENVPSTNPTSVVSHVKTIVSRQAKEFHEFHSKELVRFYNPYNPEQQKDFKDLIEPWLNERLKEDGIKVVVEKFTIS